MQVNVHEFARLAVESIRNFFSRVFVSGERHLDGGLCDCAQRFSCCDGNFPVLVFQFELLENALQCVRPRLVVRAEFVSLWGGHAA